MLHRLPNSTSIMIAYVLLLSLAACSTDDSTDSTCTDGKCDTIMTGESCCTDDSRAIKECDVADEDVEEDDLITCKRHHICEESQDAANDRIATCESNFGLPHVSICQQIEEGYDDCFSIDPDNMVACFFDRVEQAVPGELKSCCCAAEADPDIVGYVYCEEVAAVCDVDPDPEIQACNRFYDDVNTCIVGVCGGDPACADGLCRDIAQADPTHQECCDLGDEGVNMKAEENGIACPTP